MGAGRSDPHHGNDLAMALVAIGNATLATSTLTSGDCPGCHGPKLKEVKRSIIAVHKLLGCKEWKGDPEAIKAIRAEADAPLAEDTWLEGTVTEFSELVAWAKKAGKQIHIGDIMPICSIKHWEMPGLRKYKGKIAFWGDAVKEQDMAVAVFQELSASPSIHSSNSIIAYGCLPSFRTTQVDAIRA